MWKIVVYPLVVIVAGAFGFFASGGRVRFRRGATIQRDQCPGCGIVGENTDGTRGDAEIFRCGKCRVLDYLVYPYDVKWG